MATFSDFSIFGFTTRSVLIEILASGIVADCPDNQIDVTLTNRQSNQTLAGRATLVRDPNDDRRGSWTIPFLVPLNFCECGNELILTAQCRTDETSFSVELTLECGDKPEPDCAQIEQNIVPRFQTRLPNEDCINQQRIGSFRFLNQFTFDVVARLDFGDGEVSEDFVIPSMLNDPFPVEIDHLYAPNSYTAVLSINDCRVSIPITLPACPIPNPCEEGNLNLVQVASDECTNGERLVQLILFNTTNQPLAVKWEFEDGQEGETFVISPNSPAQSSDREHYTHSYSPGSHEPVALVVDENQVTLCRFEFLLEVEPCLCEEGTLLLTPEFSEECTNAQRSVQLVLLNTADQPVTVRWEFQEGVQGAVFVVAPNEQAAVEDRDSYTHFYSPGSHLPAALVLDENEAPICRFEFPLEVESCPCQDPIISAMAVDADGVCNGRDEQTVSFTPEFEGDGINEFFWFFKDADDNEIARTRIFATDNPEGTTTFTFSTPGNQSHDFVAEVTIIAGKCSSTFRQPFTLQGCGGDTPIEVCPTFKNLQKSCACNEDDKGINVLTVEATGAGNDVFFWDLGDGTPVFRAGDTVHHRYTNAGPFTVRVSATIEAPQGCDPLLPLELEVEQCPDCIPDGDCCPSWVAHAFLGVGIGLLLAGGVLYLYERIGACSPNVIFPADWVIMGLGALSLLVGIVMFIVCYLQRLLNPKKKKCPQECGLLYLYLWRGGFVAGVTLLYFFNCCGILLPVLAIGLILLSFLALKYWAKSCEKKCCAAIGEFLLMVLFLGPTVVLAIAIMTNLGLLECVSCRSGCSTFLSIVSPQLLIDGILALTALILYAYCNQRNNS